MLRPGLRELRWYFVVFFCLAMIMAIANIAEPFIYGSIIDRVIQGLQGAQSASQVFAEIAPFLLAWIGVVFVSTILNAAYSFLRWYVGNTGGNAFSHELLRRLLFLDMRRFRDQKSGEIVRRFSNAWDAFFNLHEILMRDYLPAIMLFVVGLALGWHLHPTLTLVALVPIPLILAVGVFQVRRTEPKQQAAIMLWDKACGLAGDAFMNIATVKAFVGETRMVKLYHALSNRAIQFQHRVNRQWALSDALYGGLFVFGRLAVFYVGVAFILREELTIGTLIMFLGLLSFLFGAVERVTGSWLGTSREIGRLDRATDFWFEVPEIRDPDDPIHVPRLRGYLEFKRVSYAYTEDAQVLHDINFTIPAGKTVALVGESGAGKSTLAQLMMRFQDPSKGSIAIDGHDLRRLRLRQLRQQIGFVMQEHILFHDTIFKNIAFGKPGASRADVVAAAKRAQAHGFIGKLPKGYDAMVGERGVKLSGGEKQRIALARVFLANPPILVLDEATSALDSKTEQELQIALSEAMKDRTTLVIAHRLSTIMQADLILVMHQGKIVDRGTHADLIQRQGPYQEFWQIQAGGYVSF